MVEICINNLSKPLSISKVTLSSLSQPIHCIYALGARRCPATVWVNSVNNATLYRDCFWLTVNTVDGHVVGSTDARRHVYNVQQRFKD
jgi:hypothetical protein